MLEAFRAYKDSKSLCESGDRILLAVSGGVDSVAMAHLFYESGFTCAIAHCNFQLRGADSDADEEFVRSLGASLEMPVFVEHFQVEMQVREKGISVQMAARELRYDWFSELRSDYSYDFIATAHNLNDSVESFFLNLSRGTGIRGLVGIPAKNEQVIRPLLFASRADIETYSRKQKYRYRIDSSNQDTKYRRNKIRHDIIPVMEQLNPNFIETMASSMQHLSEVDSIFKTAVELMRDGLFHDSQDRITIDIKKLVQLVPRQTWIYELFSPFGFTRSQCQGIEKIMDAESGKRSISTTHQLFKDRGQLILIKTTEQSFDRYYLDSPENPSFLPFPMDVEILERCELPTIPSDPGIACLDHDEIQYPLTIRHWNHGDYFFPLGMNQMKKLSDFFVDSKISVPEKDRIWILASGKKIVWIMGHRIDNRFRITEKTARVLLLRFQSDIGP